MTIKVTTEQVREDLMCSDGVISLDEFDAWLFEVKDSAYREGRRDGALFGDVK